MTMTMNDAVITIAAPFDSRCTAALHALQDGAWGIGGRAAAAILFGGDRWWVVEHAAVALVPDPVGPRVVGLATLAPTDEIGAGGPHVIGVFVSPSFRRRGIGAALIAALAHHAVQVYGTTATAVALTTAGAQACAAAVRKGAPLIVHTTPPLADDVVW